MNINGIIRAQYNGSNKILRDKIYGQTAIGAFCLSLVMIFSKLVPIVYSTDSRSSVITDVTPGADIIAPVPAVGA